MVQSPDPFPERRQHQPGDPPPHGRRSRDALRQAEQRLESVEKRLTHCLECEGNEQNEQSEQEGRPNGFEWYD